METKLTWEEIKKRYDQEWILLDDFDWDEEDEFPKAGVVAVHAKERREFDRLIAARAPGFDSALIFVGEPKNPGNEITTRGYSRIEFGTH